jgi:hypothetical protein
MPTLLPPTILHTPEAAPHFASIIGEAFTNDALNRAAMLYAGYIPNNAVFSPEQRQKYFLPGIERRAAAGGLLVGAGDSAAVAIW